MQANNIFQSEIQNSLSELQANLKGLKSAKEQIQTTKAMAAEVIENMNALRGNYETYLDKLNVQIENFVDTSDKNLRNRINDGVVNMRETSLAILNLHKTQREESAGLIDKTVKDISQLRQEYGTGVNNLLESVNNHLTTSKTDLELNASRNKAVIDELTTKILELQHNSTSRNREMLENLETKQTQHLALLNDRSEKSTQQMVSQTEGVTGTLLAEYRDQMKQMRAQFNHQGDLVNAFIVRFQEFMATVQALEARIAEVNFPEYFREIGHMQQVLQNQGVALEANITEVKKEARKNFAQNTREIEEAFKKQNAQLKSQKNMMIFVIIMMFILAALVLFKDFIIK